MMYKYAAGDRVIITHLPASGEGRTRFREGDHAVIKGVHHDPHGGVPCYDLMDDSDRWYWLESELEPAVSFDGLEELL